MEINKYTDIVGVVTQEAIPEGRFVKIMQNNVAGYDFGSRTELPGVKMPHLAGESAEARYIITWIVPDQTLPYYVPEPAIAAGFSLRHGGFDQAANLPLAGTTVYLTWPGQQEAVTIPSGYLALAFGQGVYTMPSGQFIYTAPIGIPGTYLRAASEALGSAANQAGMAQVNPAGVLLGSCAIVERWDATNWRLTVRTFNP